MNRILTLGVTLVTLVLAATSAFAVGNTINWGDCIGAGQQSDQTFDCTSPDAEYRLVLSVQPPSVTNFFAVDIKLDLQVATSTLSSFWHMNADGCNGSSLSISANPSLIPHTGCLTSFTGSSGSIVSSLIDAYGPGFGGANRAVILLTVSRAASNPMSLTADADYFLSYLIFRMANATEAGGPCYGCLDGVAIVYQQTVLYTIASASSGIEAGVIEIDPPGLGSNCATVNGGGSGLCAATPTRNRTWGEIKSLYR